jgi:RNA polymerase sigma factor (sigma-70 family)
VDYQNFLVEHLDLIDRVVRSIARRHRLPPADAEELASVVRLRLIDRDYAVLRKFQGRSSLATYLTTVVGRIHLDFCISRWGKWRPSSAAKRLGAAAIMLEQLVRRDGLTFDEAVTVLQTNHDFAATRDELLEIHAQLPARMVRRFAGDCELVHADGRGGAPDTSLDQEEDRQIAERVDAALAAAMKALKPRDQLILKLRFEDDLAIADIARLLRAPAKPLYRQLQGTIAALREHLEDQGIDQTDMTRVVGHPAVGIGRIFALVREPEDGSV